MTTEWYIPVLFIMRENIIIADIFISGVNMNNTWFLISGTRVLRQQKLQCSSRDISVPYILIYKKRSNFVVATTD